MSLLVILLPPRARGDAAALPPAEYAYAFSADGRNVSRQARAPAAALPRADHVCVLMADGDVGFQRVTVPKAPAARLRDALAAVLEDNLLAEPEALHLALEPGTVAGQPGWVAVVDKAWLSAVLADLEAAGLAPERVLPPAWPEALPHLHAMLPAHDHNAAPVMILSHADGVTRLPMSLAFARQQIDRLGTGQVPCSAHPAVSAAAERWLGAPVTVLGDAERALQATRSSWNLRQFDLAARHRGLRALREAWRHIGTPEWRPVRLALGALLLVQLVGLNAWAWQLERRVAARQQAVNQLLQTTHPQVRAVLDAPVQMQRETERLRAAAGRPGPADLEPMLAVAAAAWPDGKPPLRALRFESGRLTLTTTGWSDADRSTFGERARAAGYQAEHKGEQTVLTRTDRT